MSAELSSTLVFHAGALGDSVLLWPMLRRLRRAGRVTLVTDRAKGQLAGRELGIDAIDSERPRFTRLWNASPTGQADHRKGPHGAETPDTEPRLGEPVSRVVSFLTDQPGSVWAANARRAFPHAELELHAAPVDRPAALHLAAGAESEASFRSNPLGPIVLHVGAGSREKRWPIDRWSLLADRAARWTVASDAPSNGVVVIAGEVEAEQFDRDERAAFSRLRGRFLTDLGSLAETLRAASLVIGHDSGPTHLAAQLGVRTVALFGPTDPRRWAPIGPSTTVVAPAAPSAMGWLSVEHVVGTIRA